MRRGGALTSSGLERCVACSTALVLGDPCTMLLLASVPIDRVGRDHCGEELDDEHDEPPGCCRLLTFPRSCGTSRDLHLTSKATIDAPLVAQRPFGTRARGHGAVQLSVDALQLGSLLASRLRRGDEAQLRRPGRVGVPAAEDAADRATRRDQAERSEDAGEYEPRLLRNGPHHTSCSPTASPSSLIAIRVLRPSTSSV